MKKFFLVSLKPGQTHYHSVCGLFAKSIENVRSEFNEIASSDRSEASYAIALIEFPSFFEITELLK